MAWSLLGVVWRPFASMTWPRYSTVICRKWHFSFFRWKPLAHNLPNTSGCWLSEAPWTCHQATATGRLVTGPGYWNADHQPGKQKCLHVCMDNFFHRCSVYAFNERPCNYDGHPWRLQFTVMSCSLLQIFAVVFKCVSVNYPCSVTNLNSFLQIVR